MSGLGRDGGAHHDHGPRSFWARYVFSFDHKVIGIQYMVTALVMAVVAGTLSMLIRLQVAWPGENWPLLAKVLPAWYADGVLKPEAYLSLVTMHGTIMVFFVVSLALVSGFGNFLIPLMIGARDMAYPLLNMLSYWTIVPACILILASFFVEGGAAAAGWTAYPPLSALPGAVPGSGLGQTLWLLAMALFIVSFTMGGLNYLTTILNLRAPGMSLMRMPMTVWTMLISTILGLLSFPALTAAAVLLLFDRHFGTSFYLPAGLVLADEPLANQGGTPLLFQHLFWFLGHPEVYVLVLPALGIAFDVVALFGRRPVFGYRTSIWALGVITVLSMIVWGHHMFTSGMNPYLAEYFSVATVAITVPFAVLGLNLVASLWRSRMRLTTAMYFALGLVSAVGTGGLGGLYLGTVTSDVYFHDSYFVVGHFHFMIGVVTLFAIFAGLYTWFPKMFGRRMNETLGKVHFWLTIIPVFIAFVTMHYLGMAGHLRRVYDPTVYEVMRPLLPWNRFISYAAFTVGTAQFLFMFNFVWSAFRGQPATDNLWQSAGLEWTTPSPAPHGNWPGPVPRVERWPYDYQPDRIADGYLPQVIEDCGDGPLPQGAAS